MKYKAINNSYREKLLLFLIEKVKPIYRQFLRKSRLPWTINITQLSKFPPKTLGKDLALFLEREKLQLMPFFENHDIMHVLLGYKNTVLEEARMQFFLLGNGKRTLFTIGTCCLSILLLPEFLKQFLKDYKKGRVALSLVKWDFRHLLHEPTALLQGLLKREPSLQKPFIF